MTELSQDPWDDSYFYYEQLADLLSAIASSHNKVDIDQDTLLRWRDLMGVMREIDTQADDSGASHDEILRQLESFEGFEGRYPHVAPDNVGQETFDKLINRTRKILKLGDYVSRATTASRYVKLRASEALHTAEVFHDSASPHVASQARFGNSFMPLLRRMAVASSFIDSAHDLKNDYVEAKSVLPPLNRTRLELAVRAIGITVPLAPVALHRDVIIQTALAAKMQHRRKTR